MLKFFVDDRIFESRAKINGSLEWIKKNTPEIYDYSSLLVSFQCQLTEAFLYKEIAG